VLLICSVLLYFIPLANAIGDVCINDFDGDGVANELDNCPRLKSVNTTSFDNHILVDLANPTSVQLNPNWKVLNDVS